MEKGAWALREKKLGSTPSPILMSWIQGGPVSGRGGALGLPVTTDPRGAPGDSLPPPPNSQTTGADGCGRDVSLGGRGHLGTCGWKKVCIKSANILARVLVNR